MATSDDTTNPEQEPEQVFRPDYIKVAKAFEQRAAEAPADDAILDTLAKTLAVYEADIRRHGEGYKAEFGVRPPWVFGERLALACRLAYGFKPEPLRDDLGDLMAELVEDFKAYEQDVERRIENLKRGVLPDEVERAWVPVEACTDLLWALNLEAPPDRAATAAARRYQRLVDYLAEEIHKHMVTLRRAIYGFDDEDPDDDGEDLAA